MGVEATTPGRKPAKRALRLLLAALFCAIGLSAPIHAQGTLDWDSVAWPPGSLSETFVGVGGGDVTVTLSGTTGALVDFDGLPSPHISMTNTGSLLPAQNSLSFRNDYDDGGGDVQEIIVTIDFTHPGGVDGVSFNTFDIDLELGHEDEIEITATDGSSVFDPSVVATGPRASFDGTRTVTGTGACGPTSSECNASVAFLQPGITQLTIVAKNTASFFPGLQDITLHDISFGFGAGLSLSGNVSADPDGNADMIDGVPLQGVTVGLADAGFVVGPTTTTDALGNYTFTGVLPGIYNILVDSRSAPPTLTTNGVTVATDLWLEQTYGTVGALCDDGTGTTIARSSPGPCYGGRHGAVSDNFTDPAAAEHAAQVLVASADLTGFDFGFSPVVVVNAGDGDDDLTFGRSVQGSLRQFIENANGLTGAQTMRFVPAVPTNASGAGGDWWEIALTGALPALNTPDTELDARAYDLTNPTVLLDPHAVVAEVTTGPELVLDASGAGALATLRLDATRITVRGVGVEASDHHGVRIQADDCVLRESTIVGNDNDGVMLDGVSSGVQILDNVFRANGVSVGDGIGMEQSSNVVISGNEIVGNAGYGIDLRGPGAGNFDNVIADNLIKGNGVGGSSQIAGIGLRAGSGSSIAQNTISGNAGDGIVVTDGAGHTITENAIFANGELAIDLGATTTGDGVTLNDNGDGDGDPNGQLNFPVLETAVITGGNLAIAGWARPGSLIEFFVADGDATGFGEGQIFLLALSEGSVADSNAGTGSYGPGTVNGWNQGTDTTNRFLFTVPTPPGVSVGSNLTATATDASGNTSEFSGVVTIPGGSGGSSCIVDPAGTYIEAEHFTGTIVQGTATFSVETTTSSFNGAGYLLSNNGGTDGSPVHEGKEYQVEFSAPGVYNVWIRGFAETISANSIFVGLNGASVGALTESATAVWLWTNDLQLGSNQITVPTAGVHTLNVWVREPSHRLDGIYITQGAEIPSGGIPAGKTTLDPTSCDSSISGTVFEDVNGDADPVDAVAMSSFVITAFLDGGDGQPDGLDDVLVTNLPTDVNGDYSLPGLAPGTYWIRANSRTLPLLSVASGFTRDYLWPEQTYAATGALCADGAGGFVTRSTPGPCYGGRRGMVSDDPSNLNDSEHVIRVVVPSADTTDVDFGFSFNVVVNTRDGDNDLTKQRTIQGSLRQFILNAKVLDTANDMRFVPAVPTNASGASGSWWEVATVSPLPSITDKLTTLNGTAYDLTDGTSVIDPNGVIAEETTGPELVINAAAGGPGLHVSDASVTMRHLGIRGAAGATELGTGIYITDPLVAGSVIDACTVWGNDVNGIMMDSGAAGVQVNGSVVRDNGQVDPRAHGISMTGAAGCIIDGNEIVDNPGFGIALLSPANDNNTFSNNTIKGSGSGGMVRAGIGVINGNNNTFNNNTITANAGDGVVVAIGNGNTLIQNSISGNGELGIDLGAAANGNDVTLNDDGDVDLGPNQELNYPVLESAELSGGSLTLRGLARPDSIIQFFIADADGSQFGEGETYLLSRQEGSGGDGDGAVASYGPLPVNGIAQGEDTTNRFVFVVPIPAGVSNGTELTATATDASGNTSEFSGLVTVTGTGSSGCVVDAAGTYIEAENFTGTISQGSATFSIQTNVAGFNGTGYLLSGGSAPAGSTPPQEGKEYRVEFDTPGIYNIWIRGYGLGTSSNSAFVGLNGSSVGSLQVNSPFSQWSWTDDANVGSNQINVPSAGVHTLNLWIRESVFRTDGIYITQGGETPSGGIPAGKTVLDPTVCNSDISGIVYEDSDFAGTPTEWDGGANDVALANVDVELYDGADSFVATTNTDGSGQYSFTSLPDGNYKVRVRSTTIGDVNTPPAGGLNGSVPGTWPYPLPEMTWGNGAPLLGGQNATLDDTATPNDGGPGDTWASASLSGADVTAVNLGFAYNLIVNTLDDTNADDARSTQGSLRQFIKNANGIGTAAGTTANSSRFLIPPTDPGYDGSGNGEYTIRPDDLLPVIAGPTVLDATTHPDFSNKPLIEIDAVNVGGTADCFRLDGDNAELRGFVINGCGRHAVEVSGSGNVIAGNFLGTDVTGNGPRGTANDGINLNGDGNTIGGTGPLDGNVISGTGDNGIETDPGADGNIIKGNLIGVGFDGTTALGNTSHGIQIESDLNIIGGPTAPEANHIAFNGSDGVMIRGGGTSGNTVSGNSIHDNNDLGIDLADDGVTRNDSSDGDGNPNQRLNFPVLDTASISGGNLIIDGWARPNVAIELFIRDTDSGEFGEGLTYLLSLTEGSASDLDGSTGIYGPGLINGLDQGSDNTNRFEFSVPVPAGVVVGTELTATATDGSGNTSEFSGRVAVADFTPLAAISGTVFEDADFAGTPTEWDGGANDVALANVDVELYDGADSFVATTNTDGSGQYSFTSLPDGIYKVRVRSTTIGDVNTPPAGELNGSVPGTWPYPLPEMTWGNGAPLVGGQNAALDDAATPNDGGPGDTWASVSLSGADVTAVNLGFAYNLIVNTLDDSNADDARSTQGSLRQFIKNANAIGTAAGTTANRSEFRIPNTDPGYDGSGNGEFTVRPDDPLPVLAGPCVVDGTSQTGFSGTPLIEIDGTNTGGEGLVLTGGNTEIRGLVLNRFSSHAVVLSSSGNLIAGNFIGTDVTGNAPRSNGDDGINLDLGGNTIGGTGALDPNVISANGDNGIETDPGADGNIVKGNLIGVGFDGTTPLGNTSYGLQIDSSLNTIGGPTAPEANHIAFNGVAGVTIRGGGTSGNTVSGNSIHDNTELGIDLANDGVTRNDSGDGDGDPNRQLNFPVLDTASISGGNLIVDGWARPNVAVELFIRDTDTGDFGEGLTFLYSLTEGSASDLDGGTGSYGPGLINGLDQGSDTTNRFEFSVPVPAGVAAGTELTATATDAGGNTSEFGGRVVVANVTPPAAISGTVFEDADFAGTATGWDGGVGDRVLPAVDVELYDASDVHVASVVTNASGVYSFSSLAPGTYKVRVRSATIGDADTPPTGGHETDVPATLAYPIPEMTWADGAAMIGGQDPAVDDQATGDDAGPGDTYITVTLNAADVITGIDLGFAFNLIVNTLDDTNVSSLRSTQGSLRQFIKNANAIVAAASSTAHSSQFRIPISDLGYDLAGQGEFTIRPTVRLPSVLGGTVLDGTTQPGFATTPIVVLDGSAATGTFDGLEVQGDDSIVRGFAINNFGVAGIRIDAEGIRIVGNFIGTDVSGTSAQPNSLGIEAESGRHFIGDNVDADRNVISGNTLDGIVLIGGSDQNEIKGNYIGVASNGSAPLGNGGAGIRIASGGNLIGDTPVTSRNVIAFNGGAGVAVEANEIGNTIRGNSIHDNVGLGIDLQDDGITPNIAGDADSGPNELQNFPEISFAASDGISTTVTGDLNSTADTTFTVDLYSSPTGDPLGNGEGQVHLGSLPVTTEGFDGSFDVSLPSPTTVGHVITATATSPAGSTSEFGGTASVIAQTQPLGCNVFVDQDSYLKQQSPDNNEGTHEHTHSRNDPGKHERPVMRYDLSGIPVGSTITSATAWYFVVNKDDTGLPVNVYRATSAWTESGVTWNNFVDEYDISTVHGAFAPVSTGWINVSLTSLVQEWVDGTHLNHGLMMLSTSSNKDSKFASNEWGTAAELPCMEVVFAAPLDLQVAKTVDDPAPDEGDTITYTVTVTNNGPAQATNVSLDDVLPAGLTGGLVTPITGSWTAPTWTVGTLNSGASATLAIQATVDAGASSLPQPITNSVSNVALDQVDSNATADTPNVDIVVDSSAVTVDDVTETEGTGLLFTVTLDNATAGAFTVDVTLSDVSATGGAAPLVSPVDYDNVVATLNFAGTAGETEQFTVATLDDGIAEGTETFTVSLNASDPLVTDTDTGTGTLTDNDAGLLGRYCFNEAGAGTGPTTVLDDQASPLNLGITYDAPVAWSTHASGNRGLNAASEPHTGFAEGLTAGTKYETNLDGANAVTLTYVADIQPTGSVQSLGGFHDNATAGEIMRILVEPNGRFRTNVLYGTNNKFWVDWPTAYDDGVRRVYHLVYDSLHATNSRRLRLYVDGVDQGAGTLDTGSWPSLGDGLDFNNPLSRLRFLERPDGDWDLEGTVYHFAVYDSLLTDAEIATDAAALLIADDCGAAAGIDLHVTKTADDSAPDEGDTITYTVTVTNNGPGQATNVSIDDVLPAGLTIGTVTPSGSTGWSDPTWTIGTLNDTESATLLIQATVDPGASTLTQPITNTVSNVQLDQTDSNTTADDLSEDLTVNSDADLVVTKTVDDSTPDEGQTITYTITVTNNGPAQATSVSLDDLLPAGLAAGLVTPSVGSWTAPTWTIGTLSDGDSETLDIQATVNSGTSGSTITNTVSAVTLDQTDSDTTPDTLSVDLNVGNSTDLVITKSVDDLTPAEGGTVTYIVTVNNNGPAQATNVSLDDVLPAGLTGGLVTPSTGSWTAPTWTLGTLNSGASATLDIQATVNAGQGGSTITNTVTAVTLDQIDINGTADTLSVDVNVGNSTDLVVTKTVDDATPDEGDMITYTVTVTNNGPAQATNVSLDDVIPAGLTVGLVTPSTGSWAAPTWTIGAINSGVSVTLDIQATVNPGQSGATITNTVTGLTLDQTDTNATADTLSVDVNVGNSTDLVVIKIVDDATPDEGDTVTYTVTVTNNGPAQATGVALDDVLPAGLTEVFVLPSSGIWAAPTWAIGPLSNGASATLDIQATVNAGQSGSTITNTVTGITLDQIDSNATSDTPSVDVNVGNSTDLQVVKTVDDATPDEGDTITYTITVNNNGPAQATNLSLDDLLPAGLTAGPTTPGTGSWTAPTWTVGTLASGASATLDIQATVNAGQSASTITNTVTGITLDQIDTNATADTLSVDLTVGNSTDLVVSKTVDDATPDEGDTISYTVTVTNNGPAQATNISLVDLLPAGLTAGLITPSSGSWAAPNWTLGTLSSGASATLNIQATVDVGQSGSTITNTVTGVTLDQADTNASADTLSVDLTVGNSTDLVVSKTVDDATPDEGDTISYTVTVSNNGPAQATNVSLDDVLPAGLTAGLVTPSAGSWTAPSWTIGTLDDGASATLTLQASVDAGQGGSTITNTVTGVTLDQNDSNATADALNVDVNVGNSTDLVVVKTVDDATPDEGGTVSYTLTITNNGPAQATNVSVDDVLPAGLTAGLVTPSAGSWTAPTWTLGTLNSGASATLTIQSSVDVGAASLPQPIVNTVSNVSMDQAYSNASADSLSVDISVSAIVDLELTMLVDDPSPSVGDSVELTLSVDNAGPSAASGVAVQLVLPPGYLYLSDDSGGSYESASGVWTIGAISAGSSAELRINAQVLADTNLGAYDSFAEVVSTTQPDVDSTPANGPQVPAEDDEAVLSILPSARIDLALSSVVDNSTPAIGSSVLFTFTVENSVGFSNASGVAVVALLPSGYAYLGDDSGGSYDDSTGIWSVGPLAQGSNASLNINASVLADLSPGAYVTFAEVTAADQPDFDSTPANGPQAPAEDDETTRGLTPVGTDGVVTITSSLIPGDTAVVSVDDRDADVDPGVANTISVTVTNESTGETELLTLTETGPSTGVFSGTVATTYGTAPGVDDDGTFNTQAGDTLTVTYVDLLTSTPGGSSTPVTASGTVAGGTDASLQITAQSAPGDAISLLLDDADLDNNPGLAETVQITVVNDMTGESELVTLNETGISSGSFAGTLDTISGTTAGPDDDGVMVTRAGDTLTATYNDLLSGSGGPAVVTATGGVLLDAIRLTKTASKTEAVVGEIVGYEIVVENTLATAIAGVTLSDLIPPGFKLAADTPSLGRAGSDGDLGTGDDVVSALAHAGGRPVLFGPFDLAANESVAIHYVLRVGSGARPSDYVNTVEPMQLGAVIGTAASATVEIVADPVFDQARVIGKVFVDANRNGLQDADEPGVPQAHVYLDDGTYSVTDRHGRYHFPLVGPGQRLLKLNRPSLPPGAEIVTEESRIVWISPGLTARANFGVVVELESEKIGRPAEHGVAVTGSTEHYPIEIQGRAGALKALVNGKSVDFATGQVRLRMDQIEDTVQLVGSRLQAPLGFDLEVDSADDVERWSLEIRTGSGQTVRSFEGLGAPPANLAWDGKDSDGRMVIPQEVYVYQLALAYVDGRQGTSDRRIFGVNRDRVFSLQLTGNAFEVGQAVLNGDARTILNEARDMLRKFPDDKIVIEGHTDSQGTDEYNLDLSKRRAQAAAEFLVHEARLPAERIVLRWFGEERPVASNQLAEGRELNRRVELKAELDERERAQVAKRQRTAPVARINGAAVSLRPDGRFISQVPPDQVDSLAIEMGGPDGASVSRTVPIPRLAILSPSRTTIVPAGSTVCRLEGNTNPGNSLFVDGNETVVDAEGRFTADLDLAVGRNDFGLLVSNEAGYSRSANLVVDLSDQDDTGGRIVVTEAIPNLSVELPAEQSTLAGSTLGFTGSTDPGNEVFANDLPVEVARDGSFVGSVELPAGPSDLILRVVDAEGREGTIQRRFETKRNQLFMLAFGEAEFGKLEADGMIEGAGLDDDDFYTEGRLAFYLKGRVAGKYLMTAAFDSGREDVGDLFSDIDGEAEERLLTNLDPDRYYPVYGDDSTVHYDVESQGKFYLALDSDSIHLLVGNYPLSLNQTELAAYQRTLYGARFVYQSASKTEFGEPDTQVVLFAADVSYTHVRDELRATGGSLYYLSHRDVVEGSEEVTLVVRDQNTGLVLSRRRQRPNADYTVKYPEGRLMFHRTISSVADGGSLFDRDMLSGNSVFIQVDYETVLDSFEKTASGGRVSRSIGDRVVVGGTAISDELAGGTYDLQALDAEVRLGQGSKLKAEFADSEGADSLTYVSDDGGLTYNEVAISGMEQGSAWKLAAELDVGEWFDRPGRYRVNMYYKELEPGFFSSGNFLEQGTEKLGFDGAFDLTGRDTLRVRFDNEDRTDPSGSPAASTESTIGSALWQHQRKRWRLSVEYFNDEVEDGSGNSIRDAQFGSARIHSDLTDRLTGHLEHQQTLSGTSNDQSSLGLAYQVLPSLALELKGTDGDRGSSAQAGGVLTLGESEIYLNQRIAEDRAGETTSTVIGARAPLGRASKVYSEYQIEQGETEDRAISLVGLQKQWEPTPGMRLQLTGESANVDGTSARRRTVFGGGFSYSDDERWTALTRAELRREGGATRRDQFLGFGKLDYRLNADFTLEARYRYSRTRNPEGGALEAKLEERSLGVAYRPTRNDRFNSIARYTHLFDLRPLAAGDLSTAGRELDVLAIETAYQINPRIEWLGKAAGRIQSEAFAGSPEVETRAYLTIQRFNFNVWKPLGVGLEYRRLIETEADDQNQGWLSEFTWDVLKQMRVGVGYNFTDFTDDELSSNDYSVRGWFFRVQGRY